MYMSVQVKSLSMFTLVGRQENHGICGDLDEVGMKVLHREANRRKDTRGQFRY